MIKTKVNFKSGLEVQFHKKFGIHLVGYELAKIPYTIDHTYHPDFTVVDNVFIETKGIWDSADRTKIKTVLKQNPNVTIAMVFQKPNQKLYKGAKSTYADYCEKNKIQWFDIKDADGIQRFIDNYK